MNLELFLLRYWSNRYKELLNDWSPGNEFLRAGILQETGRRKTALMNRPMADMTMRKTRAVTDGFTIPVWLSSDGHTWRL